MNPASPPATGARWDRVADTGPPSYGGPGRSLGAGIPFLAGVANGPVQLGDPEVIEAPGVTHLRYRVRRASA